MTGNITMFDSAYNDQFPAGGEAYAAYVDGGIGSQPNYAHIVSAFSKAQHLSITLSAGNDAEVLDIEYGAATPESAASWYARQISRGMVRPCLYASVDLMAERVIPVLNAMPVARAKVRLWTAHYDGSAHICGPGTCGLLPIEADGTQWTCTAMGRDLDQSLLLPGFFGPVTPPKPPADWTYGAPSGLRATGGHTTVALTWKPPAGEPVPAAEYHVYVYEGTVCTWKTLVAKYPRTVTVPRFEGGSLQQGKQYTAHVVASGVAGARTHPFTYGSVAFKTG